ncbi:S9 family peptidase [Streptacidiphilus sp. P02-A3a]|uniref:alpha/beta hydrolase family protein n=1 Tax=Streptacidiphilus sp. P02-A3a TaxID=2704468 RepID=UPI0015F843AC|nr:alpha/beta hydrolase [Streptacidiphilus sp. P02-A3a]QMU67346.1 alpha/beta hydrolase [Streptacidiphilus sp. P02-A3a]
MPVNPHALAQRDPRFADQRWLLDLAIELMGPEWDQDRLHYLSAPVSADHTGAILGLRESIRKFDDFTREMATLARHFELRGDAQRRAGHVVSAADDHFAAAILYGGAQWPIFANTELNVVLEQKKTDCYTAYTRGADHPIEPVEIPYDGRSLTGWFHLPAGRTAADGPLPCVVMLSGMDGFKEMNVFASADRYLRRGMAVLSLDGPGQGTSLVREIWYEPDRFGEVGVAAYTAVAARPEVDPARVMLCGVSQGSFWTTQMAAAEPRYAACAVMFTCFDPGNTAMFTTLSPTFRQRFMYMTGSAGVEELDAKVATMTVDGLGKRIRMPYLAVMGEDDPLCDPVDTYGHLNAVAGPKELLLYTGEHHAPVTRPSGRRGPQVFLAVADWLADRAAGIPFDSRHTIVDARGLSHTEPWGDDRRYTYGAPLDPRTLLGEGPGTGLS